MYSGLILLLSACIAAVLIILIMFHFDNQILWKKNQDSLTYEQLKIQKTNAVLNKQMKIWLAKKQNVNKKYYRAVIKGFGSTGKINKGYGTIKSNVKRFYVSNDQITVQQSMLKFRGMVFSGSWQLIPITPQQYIYCVISERLQ